MNMETVSVSSTVRQVRCQKDGFVALVLNSGETVSGNVDFPIAKDDALNVSGFWVDNKWGRQIKAVLIQRGMPRSDAAMAKWLAETVDGVGKAKATALVKEFGQSLMQIAAESPDMLLKVHGITQAIADAMHGYATTGDKKQKLLNLLGQHEVRGQRAKNALEVIESVEQLEQNPYRLLQVEGIDFQTADRFARSFDIPADSPLRIQAGLVHVLRHAARSGQHTCLPVSEWIAATSKRLCLPPNAINAQIGSEAVLDEVVLLNAAHAEKDAVERIRLDSEAIKSIGKDNHGKTLYAALKPFYNAERDIAEYIKLRAGKVLDRQVPPQSAFPGLNDLQYEALRVAMTRHVSILTGGPGTGKTFTLKAIVQAERMINPQAEIILMSHTGVASKVMTKAIGEKATTIHLRLCSEKLEAELQTASLVVIDEMGVVDSPLCAELTRKIHGNDDTRLLLVGDPDQLPSIGVGDVLQDLIDSGAVPVTRLNQLYRADPDSQIAMNSERILNGELPVAGNDTFLFCEKNEPDMQRRIVQIVTKLTEKGVDLGNIQLMSGMYKGDAGIDALNAQLQGVFSQAKDGLSVNGETIKKGDRVLFTENNRELDLVNGDIGIVLFTGVAADGNGDYNQTVIVAWNNGRRVNLTGESIYSLRLAYASSVHRAQGSGYECVVISLPASHRMILNRRILRTANSRAEKRVYLVYMQEALQHAVSNDERFNRHTLLGKLLTNVYT